MSISKTGLALIVASLALVACGSEQPSAPVQQKQGPATGQTEPIAPNPAKTTPANPPITKPETITLPQQYTGADLTVGKRQYASCKACHTLGEGQAKRVGPNLYGIFGKAAAASPKFRYSKAMRQSNLVWDQENLDQWIASPRQFMPGTSMAYIGIKDAEKRRALLAYIYIETGGTLE